MHDTLAEQKKQSVYVLVYVCVLAFGVFLGLCTCGLRLGGTDVSKG